MLNCIPCFILTGILDVKCDERLQVDDRDASQEEIPSISYILLHICSGSRSSSKSTKKLENNLIFTP